MGLIGLGDGEAIIRAYWERLLSFSHHIKEMTAYNAYTVDKATVYSVI